LASAEGVTAKEHWQAQKNAFQSLRIFVKSVSSPNRTTLKEILSKQA
jgi:hypothetical protein